jgi:non-specific serine/threonine protein kinase
MRARLGAAPPAADGAVIAAGTVAPVVIDAVPSSPEPASQPATPAPAAQEPDALVAFPPDPDPVADSGTARIDDDPALRPTFARQAPRPRRIARWGGAALVLLALLLIGPDQFDLQGQVARVLDVLGISRGPGAAESAAESADAAAPATPVTPPIAADAGGTTPTPTQTQTTTADSSSATAPASPASAPVGADGGGANPTPIKTTAADSPPSATPPASLGSPTPTTLSPAATAAPAEPAVVAQARAALTPPPTRGAQQLAARAPASPREACGPRTQFSLYRCMKMQCSQRRWASHAQCQRLRITDSVD